jgi:hypothetical protein
MRIKPFNTLSSGVGTILRIDSLGRRERVGRWGIFAGIGYALLRAVMQYATGFP